MDPVQSNQLACQYTPETKAMPITHLADNDDLYTVKRCQLECTEDTMSGRENTPTSCIHGNLLHKCLEAWVMKNCWSAVGKLFCWLTNGCR